MDGKMIQDRQMARAAVMGGDAWLPLFGAWLVALFSTLGAIFIGEVMGQTPCDLCWFQRSFMFPLSIILAIAVFRADWSACIYAVPLAFIGWLISAFHNLLYFGVLPTAIKPCGQGPSCSGEGMTILGMVPLPLLSLAAFTAIIVLLIAVRRRTSP